jgi:hypothetical protein
MNIIKTPNTVDTYQQFALGTLAMDEAGKIYIYLKGVASTAIGSWVTYDEAGLTTLLVANAIGPVAVAKVACVADKYAWYQVFGSCSALLAANCADNATLGKETTDGYAGDGRAAGDQLVGAISRGATTDAGLATVQLNFPYATDALGS